MRLAYCIKLGKENGLINIIAKLNLTWTLENAIQSQYNRSTEARTIWTVLSLKSRKNPKLIVKRVTTVWLFFR